jgi:hypothetical protein
MSRSRQYRLAARPEGAIKNPDFELVTAQIPEPANNEFVVQITHVSIDLASAGRGNQGLFAAMGFGDELAELEQRRDRGTTMPEPVAATPDEMLQAVGYYGPAGPAPAAFARLSAGLDEAIVRISTARPSLEPVAAAMAALTPTLIRTAPRSP